MDQLRAHSLAAMQQDRLPDRILSEEMRLRRYEDQERARAKRLSELRTLAHGLAPTLVEYDNSKDFRIGVGLKSCVAPAVAEVMIAEDHTATVARHSQFQLHKCKWGTRRKSDALRTYDLLLRYRDRLTEEAFDVDTAMARYSNELIDLLYDHACIKGAKYTLAHMEWERDCALGGGTWDETGKLIPVQGFKPEPTLSSNTLLRVPRTDEERATFLRDDVAYQAFQTKLARYRLAIFDVCMRLEKVLKESEETAFLIHSACHIHRVSTSGFGDGVSALRIAAQELEQRMIRDGLLDAVPRPPLQVVISSELAAGRR